MSEDDLLTRLTTMEQRSASLEARVATLEGKRPGRKALPVVVSEWHVCGVAPGTNSKECPHASHYRRQRGCKGDRCVQIANDYAAARRASDRQKKDGS